MEEMAVVRFSYSGLSWRLEGSAVLRVGVRAFRRVSFSVQMPETSPPCLSMVFSL